MQSIKSFHCQYALLLCIWSLLEFSHMLYFEKKSRVAIFGYFLTICISEVKNPEGWMKVQVKDEADNPHYFHLLCSEGEAHLLLASNGQLEKGRYKRHV